MIRRLALAALAASALAGPVLAQGSADVAGRPALVTKSTEELIKQREQWGTKPALSSADAGAGPTVAGRPALNTQSTSELIKQREQWGTAPAGARRAVRAGRKATQRAAAAPRAAKRKRPRKAN